MSGGKTMTACVCWIKRMSQNDCISAQMDMRESRCGAVMVLDTLTAKGVNEMSGVPLIDRSYELLNGLLPLTAKAETPNLNSAKKRITVSAKAMRACTLPAAIVAPALHAKTKIEKRASVSGRNFRPAR